LERLQNGRLDIGFVRSMKVHSGLSQKKLLKETFSLILPSDHIIDESNFRDLSQFKNENFILFSSENNYGYYENVISIFDDHGFSPKVSHNTVHANTIYSLVENKLGIAIIPTSLCMFANNNLKFIELNNIKQRTSLSLIWNKENINPILPKIIDTL
jgi:DNA-binding transcriptional LysR family regulator